jgi:hypothetical protein
MDQTDLPQETFIAAIEAALYSAAKRRYGSTRGVSIRIDSETGEIKCYVPKKVVEIMHSFAKEIPIEEALKIKPDAQFNEIIEVEVDPKDFGRIEVQTARQILVQKLKKLKENRFIRNIKPEKEKSSRGMSKESNAAISSWIWNGLKVYCPMVKFLTLIIINAAMH